MNCKEVERILADNVSAGATQELRPHLSECVRCRIVYEELSSIKALSEDLAEGFGAPDGFSSQVFDQTASLPRGSSFGFGPLTAAVLGLLLALSLSLWSGFGVEAPKPSPQLSSPSLAQDFEFSIMEPTPLRLNAPAPGFVNVVVENPSNESVVVRLPSTIRISRTRAPEKPFIQYVNY